MPAADLAQFSLLTEPYLLCADGRRVAVVWCTEFAGDEHFVLVGEAEMLRNVDAGPDSKAEVTYYPAISRFVHDVAEDLESHTRRTDLLPTPAERIRSRPIWRHHALVPASGAGSYRVISLTGGVPIASNIYPLWTAPELGEPVSLLLTSDHQASPLAAVGMTAAAELGPFRAVVVAGDLVRMPNRGSDWFDESGESAFFPVLQGRAAAEVAGRRWSGSALLQQVPIVPVPGNHEFSGPARPGALIGERFNETQPYSAVLPDGGATVDVEVREKQANGSSVYRQLFAEAGGDLGWYAVTIGDTRIVCLSAAAIWRPRNSTERPERDGEDEARAGDPDRWGYGQHVLGFGLEPSSPQYRWLVEELEGVDFTRARTRVVVLHHPIRHLGGELRKEREDGNQDDEALPFDDPVVSQVRDPNGSTVSVSYQHTGHDQLLEELEPLLGSAGVDLIVNGHSHVWNRFYSPWGPVILETSNAGGTRAPEAFQTRPLSTTGLQVSGDPVPATDQTGLPAAFPTVELLVDQAGRPRPYLSSEHISEFSVLDTGSRMVHSFYVVPAAPDAAPVLFDSAPLPARPDREV